MKVQFAALHEPLFHGGKNHGQKLFAKAGIELEYDRAEKELCVRYNGQPTYLPSTSVQNYTPVDSENGGIQTPPPPRNISHPQDVTKIKSAQVETPMGHVFEGTGRGRKRDK